MKIIIVGPASPLRGGIADFNEALALELQKQNDEIIIHSFYYQYPSFLFPGTSQFSSESPDNRLYIKPTISSVNPLSWFKTSSQIINEKPDLVIIRYWLPFMAPALGTIAKNLRKNKIKVIAITDNVIPHEKRAGDKMFTQYFVNNCDGFIAMSSSVLNDLRKFTQSENKIFLPHPVYNIFGERIPKQEARNKLNINSDDRIILFFGFIRKYKGLHILLDAMNDKRIKDLNIKLIIAGEFYDDDKPYLEKIKNNDLENNVVLHTSFIDKSEIKNYFSAADIIVQPYISATQSGITQIAYFFGRPMIVTNVGGLAEIVSDKITGYVTETNALSLADAIVDYYTFNRESEFAANVDREKEKFSWSYFISGLKKLYEKIKH